MPDWFRLHRNILTELFATLGVDAPLDSGESLVVWCEEEGWYGEHGRQPGRPAFEPDAVAAAMPLLTALGLNGQVDPPARHFDEILVMGAAGIGIHRRLGLVAEGQASADRLTILAGQRPHEGFRAGTDGVRTHDGLIGELLASDSRFAADPGWQQPGHLALRAAALRSAGVDEFMAAAVLFPTESDLAAFLLEKWFPAARETTTVYDDEAPAVVNELGPRTWKYRQWRNPDPGLPVLGVLNGAPIERTNRTTGEPMPARPTSVSTFKEWLRTTDKSVQRILMIVNQPHLGRIRHQILSFLQSEGRRLEVDVAGCATTSDVDINLLLGEIPRWIRADSLGSDPRRH